MESREILFRVIVEPDLEDGGFVASTPALKGVYGQGKTEEEAMRDFQVALDFTMQAMVEEGEELPASDESARELPTVTMQAMVEEGEELSVRDESARELPTVDDPGRAFRALAEV